MTMGQNSSGHKAPQDYNGANITFAAPAAVTVANTTTAAVAENSNRKYLSVTNDSDEVMYLAFGNNAEMNKGLRLNANGGTLEWIGPNIFTGALNAICASGSKTLIYQEGS